MTDFKISNTQIDKSLFFKLMSEATSIAANKTCIFKIKKGSDEPETLEAHWQR